MFSFLLKNSLVLLDLQELEQAHRLSNLISVVETLTSLVFKVIVLEDYIFLEMCPKLNEEVAENLNRPITADKIETVIKKTPNTQKPWTRWFHRRILQSI